MKSFLFSARLAALTELGSARSTMCVVNRQMPRALLAGPPSMIHEPRLTGAGVPRQGNLSHGPIRGGLTSALPNEFFCEIIF